MNAHTSGPWEIRPSEDGMACRWIMPVAANGNGWVGNRYLSISGVMHDEDALLIAAAPDLLEALSCAEAFISIAVPRTARDRDEAVTQVLPKIRAAIAKATGAT